MKSRLSLSSATHLADASVPPGVRLSLQARRLLFATALLTLLALTFFSIGGGAWPGSASSSTQRSAADVTLKPHPAHRSLSATEPAPAVDVAQAAGGSLQNADRVVVDEPVAGVGAAAPGASADCRVVDSLPVCAAAFQLDQFSGFWTQRDDGSRVLNAAALFFCPCAAAALHASGVAAPDTWLPLDLPPNLPASVWAKVVGTLAPDLHHVLTKLLLQSKLYRAKAPFTGRDGASFELALWSTANDEGAPVVLQEQVDA